MQPHPRPPNHLLIYVYHIYFCRFHDSLCSPLSLCQLIYRHPLPLLHSMLSVLLSLLFSAPVLLLVRFFFFCPHCSPLSITPVGTHLGLPPWATLVPFASSLISCSPLLYLAFSVCATVCAAAVFFTCSSDDLFARLLLRWCSSDGYILIGPWTYAPPFDCHTFTVVGTYPS